MRSAECPGLTRNLLEDEKQSKFYKVITADIRESQIHDHSGRNLGVENDNERQLIQADLNKNSF